MASTDINIGFHGNTPTQTFNHSILNKLTLGDDQFYNQQQGKLRSLVKFIQRAQQCTDSDRLLNFITLLSVYCIISIIHGWKSENFGEIENGFQVLLHVSGFWLSLYACIKSKEIQRNNYSYGFTRIQTVSAFSNCVFLILTSLFVLLQSFHSLEIDEIDKSVTSNTENPSANVTPKTGEDHGNIYFLYAKLILNLYASFSFAEYALFAPTSQFKDIGKGMNEFAYSGLGQAHFRGYLQKISDLEVANAGIAKSFSDSNMQNRQHLSFTSHFQNMHSVFLHFLVCLLFNIGQLCTYYFHGLDYEFATIFLNFFIMLVIVILTKQLLITSAMVLLQACPIQDQIGIGQILKDISLVAGVIDIEDRQFWGMTTGFLICSLAIQIQASANPRGVQREVLQILEKQFCHVTLQINIDEEI